MLKLVKLVLTVGAAAGVVLVVQRLLAERAPRRELSGEGRLLGSLDTWPPVPRKTDGTAAA